MKKGFLIFVLAALLAPLKFYCQYDSSAYIISKKFFSLDDGLASRELFCGLQDKNGFIWLGTRNGLNRYDGKNFRLFSSRQNGLQDNKIIQLATDDANHLFILYGEKGRVRMANGKIDVMDLTTFEVKSLTQAFPKMPFKEQEVYWVTNDGTNELSFMVGHPYALWKFSDNGFRRKCRMENWKEVSPFNYSFRDRGSNCAFHQGYAAMGNAGIFYFITPDTIFSSDALKSETSHIEILGITPSKDFLFIERLGDKNIAMHKMSKKGVLEKNIKFPGSEKLINTMRFPYNSRNLDNIVFIMEDHPSLGLFDFTNVYTILNTEEMKNYANITLYQHFTDNTGKHWIITSVGLFEVKIEENRFTHYFTGAQIDAGEATKQARGIYADEKGNIYSNVWLNLYEKKGGKIKSSHTKDGILYALVKFGDKLIAGGFSPQLYDEEKNTLEIGCKGFDGEIWSMCPINDRQVLLGGSRGISLFDVGRNTIVPVKYDTRYPQPSFVYKIFNAKETETSSAKEGKLWAVAENGLFLLDHYGDVLDYYGDTKDSTHLLPFSNIFDAFEDKNGTFWLATNGDGLYRWDRKKNVFRQFNVPEGFPSGILYRIEEDNYGYLWISSDNGLIRFNPLNFTLNTYTVKDGISHNEFNRTSSFKAKDGRMFFGGLDGINAFYPKNFAGDYSFSDIPFRITGFSKFSAKENKVTDLTLDLLQKNKITMNEGDRYFDLEFALLDYENTSPHYSWRIQGLDNNWNFTPDNKIRISGLPYGEYNLQVRAQNNVGQWSKAELSIPLEFTKPFYFTYWFIAASVLGLFFLFILFANLRLGKLEAEKNELRAIAIQRAGELRKSADEKGMLHKEVHHRVKTNMEIVNELFDLQMETTDDKKLKSILTEEQSRIKSIALANRNLHQHNEKNAVEFKSFVNDLSGQIASFYRKQYQQVDFLFDIPATYLDIDTAMPLGLIVNELFINAFKHAFGWNEKGTISIVMETIKKGEYKLIFSDNGKGLPQNFDFANNESMSMKLIQRLSIQLAGKAEYKYEKGSVFIIYFKDTETRKRIG